MVSEDDNQSSRAPLSDGLGAQIQTSDNMPTWSSEVTHNFDQDPDNPLQDHENTNAAQQENAAKPYVPWFGDGSKLGPLSKFQLLLFNTRLVFLSFTLIFYICLTVLLLASPWYVRNWESFETNVGGYQAVFMSGIINWAPAECVYYILLSSPDSDKVTSGAVIVVGAILFGLLSWAYIAIVSNTNITYQAWSTGSLPHSFQGCNARVEPQQSSLFLPNIYDTQFARTVLTHSNSTMRSSFYPAFDMELSRSIQNNHTLCDSGFQGNVDLYELGIRTGLYLQWISASLANNLLPDTRQELQKVYLIFFLAICLATLVASFVKTCTFSIEIEIMYWMYLGGFVCVFATAPCSIKLGSEAKWIKLNWTTTILFTTHALMYYHGTWFIWYAYDQVFSRLPCGTYHFFLVPVLDPSETFWVLRDYLNHLLVPLIPLLTLFPFVGILLLSEIKHAIQDSAVYQILIKKTAILDSDQAVTTDSDDASVKKSLGLRLYQYIRGVYMGFREICDFPSHSREGIRLVTPIDVRKRRLYRIRWAAMGLLSCVLSIVAIELILKWNKVGGVYSITSTGQYLPLIIGVCSFVSVWWSLVRQESERRRNLQRRHAIGHREDGIEMDSLSHTFTDAFSHAFAQPDIGFSTNGGALPNTLDADEEEAASARPAASPGPQNEVFMSGALADSDMEA